MKVVTYYRVSTISQGRSGLGLEAQRKAIETFCFQRSCVVVAEYMEIESGKKDNRIELTKALHRAKATGATLVVAKMDRLSRNVAFLAALQESETKFIAADMPEANELTIHILAAVAQAERKAISSRTKEALAAAKARGRSLGNPNGAAALRRAAKGNIDAVRALQSLADSHAALLAPEVRELRHEGHRTLRDLAAGMNARSLRTPRGGQWHAASVRNLLVRLETLGALEASR